MNKKSLIAIETIITCINELKIIAKNKNDKYFYDGFEMPILCGLVSKIDKSIDNISDKIKIKYSNIKWDIIESRKHNDNDYKALTIGNVWKLSNGILEDELLKGLKSILEKELPEYYKNYCDKKHKQYNKENEHSYDKYSNI